MKLLLLSLTILLFFVNCGGKPTHLKLTITTTGDANPDAENISSPLMLKFYELKSAEKFSKLDFWTLLDNSSEKLENDMISQAKHIIIPNEEHVYKIVFDDNAKFIGIIASFQDIEKDAVWRFVQNLDQRTFNEIELKIDKNQMKKID